MTGNKENMQSWRVSSTTIKAACLLSVRHRQNTVPLLPTLGGGMNYIDLYLKPVKLSCAPRETLLRAPVLLSSATCRLVGSLHQLQTQTQTSLAGFSKTAMLAERGNHPLLPQGSETLEKGLSVTIPTKYSKQKLGVHVIQLFGIAG